MASRKYFLTAMSCFLLGIVGIGGMVVPTHLSEPELPQFKPSSEHCNRVAQRLIIFIFDAGRVDTLTTPSIAPHFSRLTQIGASGVHKTPQISTTGPFIKALTTGLEANIHDLFNNFSNVDLRYGSIFHETQAAGMKVKLFGPEIWKSFDQFAQVENYNEVTFYDSDTTDRLTAQRLRATLKEPKPDVMVVHFSGSDGVGHLYGGASPQYRKKINELDGYLGEVIQYLDQETVLLAVSDHGIDNYGYHIGVDPIYTFAPFVFYSKGNQLKSIQNLKIKTSDLAPTVSCLLGIPAPPHARGRILTELFQIHPDEEEKILSINQKQLKKELDSYVSAQLLKSPLNLNNENTSTLEQIHFLIEKLSEIKNSRQDSFILGLLAALLAQIGLLMSMLLVRFSKDQLNYSSRFPILISVTLSFLSLGLNTLNQVVLAGIFPIIGLFFILYIIFKKNFSRLQTFEKRSILKTTIIILSLEIAATVIAIHFQEFWNQITFFPFQRFFIKTHAFQILGIAALAGGIFSFYHYLEQSSKKLPLQTNEALFFIFPILFSFTQERYRIIGWIWTFLSLGYLGRWNTRQPRSVLYLAPILLFSLLTLLKGFQINHVGISEFLMMTLNLLIGIMACWKAIKSSQADQDKSLGLLKIGLSFGIFMIFMGHVSFFLKTQIIVRTFLLLLAIFLGCTAYFKNKISSSYQYLFLLGAISLAPLMSGSAQVALYFDILWISFLFWLPLENKVRYPVAAGVFITLRLYFYFLIGNRLDFRFAGLNDFIFLGANIAPGQEINLTWGIFMMLLKNCYVDFALLTGFCFLYPKKQESEKHKAFITIAASYLIDLSVNFILIRYRIFNTVPFYFNLPILVVTLSFALYLLLSVFILAE